MTVSVSFEVFPPKTPAGLQTLASTVSQLDAVGPAYISVTYGAGGSDRHRSFEAIDLVRQSGTAPIAGHLTCVGQTRRRHRSTSSTGISRSASTTSLRCAATHRAASMRRTNRTRTDTSRPPISLTAIKQRDASLDVSVSAYPERHPQSPTDAHDLDVLAAKVDAGADRAMTQMFFDNAHYLAYVDRVRARRIDVPIVPGIFPIHSFPAVARFAERCGATIPAAVAERFDGLDDDPAATHEVATEVAATQILELAEHGVEHVHIYTLNRAELALAVCDRLSLVTA